MRTMQVDNFVERQVVAKQPSLHFLAKLINLQNYGNADYQRWKASWESERAVGQVLNALDARYYNYAGLPLKVLNPTSGAQDIDHVVVGPTGIYAIEAKNWAGRVTFDARLAEWRRSKRGDPPVIERSPSVEVKRGTLVLRQILGVDVAPLIVFTNSTVELVDMETETDDVTVVTLANLVPYLSGQPEVFDTAAVNALVSELDVRVATWKATAGSASPAPVRRLPWPLGALIAAIGIIALIWLIGRPTLTPAGQPSLIPTTKIAVHDTAAPIAIVPITVTPTSTAAASPVAITLSPTAKASSTQSASPLPATMPATGISTSVGSSGSASRADTLGLYRNGAFYLRLSNSTGPADLTIIFNPATTPAPIGGDWTGSGYDTIGIFDKGTAAFTLCKANDTDACGDPANLIQFPFGRPGDQPLAGRWQPNQAADGIGVFHAPTATFAFKNALSAGNADFTMTFGLPGDIGIIGDWTASGYSGLGMYRLSTNVFYLSSQISNGTVHPDLTFGYAVAGRVSLSSDIPIAGNWTGSGRAGIGLFRQTTGDVYLRNELTTGDPDLTFKYGTSGDLPISGHWASGAKNTVSPGLPH